MFIVIIYLNYLNDNDLFVYLAMFVVAASTCYCTAILVQFNCFSYVHITFLSGCFPDAHFTLLSTLYQNFYQHIRHWLLQNCADSYQDSCLLEAIFCCSTHRETWRQYKRNPLPTKLVDDNFSRQGNYILIKYILLQNIISTYSISLQE